MSIFLLIVGGFLALGWQEALDDEKVRATLSGTSFLTVLLAVPLLVVVGVLTAAYTCRHVLWRLEFHFRFFLLGLKLRQLRARPSKHDCTH